LTAEARRRFPSTARLDRHFPPTNIAARQ
jgi:hypothetical protein